MYRKVKKTPVTGFKINNSTEGETIETKVERITTLKEPIKDGAPLIYTERKDGVQAAYNPRTDRFEVAVEAMDLVTKTNLAKRENRLKAVEGGKKNEPKEGGKDTGTEGQKGGE